MSKEPSFMLFANVTRNERLSTQPQNDHKSKAMYQTPTSIWNDIAGSQPLSQPWFDLFRMEYEELTKALEPIEREMEMQGVDSTVIRAYLLTAPLLVENEAVSSYIEMTERHDLRNSLPEICSVNEAVILATQEYRLNPSQQARLTKLLRQALEATLNGQNTDPCSQAGSVEQENVASTPADAVKPEIVQAHAKVQNALADLAAIFRPKG